MLDIGKYIIDEPYQQYGNGYDQLEGDYAVYYKVATKFCHKARFEAVLGRALRHRLNILTKLCFIPGTEENRIKRTTASCKKDARKNLKEFESWCRNRPIKFDSLWAIRV